MKIAVLSDIHSNIDALEAVIKDAVDWGASEWLVAGDMVGYGAAPDNCIRTVRELGAACIAGNHEWGVLEKTPIDYFNAAAREGIVWTREHLSDESRKYLEGLPLVLTRGQISLSHANFLAPQSWEYVFTLDRARQEFEGFSARLGVIGHSHIPFIVRALKDGPTEQVMRISLRCKEEERLLINAGSVGQPRDGDPRACYLRVDRLSCEIALRRVTYDVAEAQRRISQAGLPISLAERLPLGR